MKASNLPKGVSLDSKRFLKKFKSVIKIDGKLKHLGYYSTPEEAHAAYLQAKTAKDDQRTNN